MGTTHTFCCWSHTVFLQSKIKTIIFLLWNQHKSELKMQKPDNLYVTCIRIVRIYFLKGVNGSKHKVSQWPPVTNLGTKQKVLKLIFAHTHTLKNCISMYSNFWKQNKIGDKKLWYFCKLKENRLMKLSHSKFIFVLCFKIVDLQK